jgi:cytochrome P450
VDTTSALLANTIHWLDGHPEARQRLIEDPSAIPVAGEEFLRVFSPVQALARNVAVDAVVGTTELPAGSRVLVSWAAANLDEREFPDADQVVLDRFPNRHQAFGLGQHRCVGSNLARVEFEVALGTLLRRLGDYRVLEGRAARYPTVGTNNGWMSIEIEFTPGRRAS